MDGPRIYEICVEGYLSEHWSDWFAGLRICHEQEGQTVLSGCLTDQAALFGVIGKIHALNLALVSVRRVTRDGKVSG